MIPLEPLDRLITVLARLPGVGRRSAERMALRLIRDSGSLSTDLKSALDEARDRVGSCSRCGHFTLRTEDPCRICRDPRRDNGQVCVVEEPTDIMLLEKAGAFQGRYHALMGKLSPMRGEGVSDLRVDALVRRVKEERFKEAILALNTDVESDATAGFLREVLEGVGVKVSRLAFGIPAGSGLSYSDPVTLQRAMKGRQAF